MGLARQGDKDDMIHQSDPYSEFDMSRNLKSLEYYILEAENEILEDNLKRKTIFYYSLEHSSPTLQRGYPNRVLVFPGFFNPPHRGHLELLCHAFLRTDEFTIAAMIIPGDDCGAKAYQSFKGLDLKLDKNQRMRLWEDHVLERFAWSWPGDVDDHTKFIQKITELASEDGFELTFTYLQGADHEFSAYNEGFDSITSDITRPIGFLEHGWNEMGKPYQPQNWDEWQQTKPASDLYKIEGSLHCPHSPCWICWKVENVFPEYFKRGFKEDPKHLAGFARKIISRCHEGVIWSVMTPKGHWQWFLSSGRKHPDEDDRAGISSSEIRLLLGTSREEDFFDHVKNMTLNPKLLIKELGIYQKISLKNRRLREERMCGPRAQCERKAKK